MTSLPRDTDGPGPAPSLRDSELLRAANELLDSLPKVASGTLTAGGALHIREDQYDGLWIGQAELVTHALQTIKSLASRKGLEWETRWNLVITLSKAVAQLLDPSEHEWVECQLRIGQAYGKLKEGDRGTNLIAAWEHLSAGLSVATREVHGWRWHMLHFEYAIGLLTVGRSLTSERVRWHLVQAFAFDKDVHRPLFQGMKQLLRAHRQRLALLTDLEQITVSEETRLGRQERPGGLSGDGIQR
jgi:hypothetical protein